MILYQGTTSIFFSMIAVSLGCLYLGICLIVAKAEIPSFTAVTSSGSVKGIKLELPSGDQVNAFLGIPYAKPPVGDFRFKKPVPVEPWKGILETNKLPNACPQVFDTAFPGLTGAEQWNPNTPVSEDCLYLSVYCPDDKGQKKTVMVYIHGGGFHSGSGSIEPYDPRYLVSLNDVIVVNINYRLGALGFLHLDHEDVDQNA